jgi:hypothetical protein
MGSVSVLGIQLKAGKAWNFRRARHLSFARSAAASGAWQAELVTANVTAARLHLAPPR